MISFPLLVLTTGSSSSQHRLALPVTDNLTLGSHKAIAILLNIRPDYRKIPREDIHQLLNGQNIDKVVNPTGSLNRYFYANSYGKYNLTFYVHDWVAANGTESQCAGSDGQQGKWDGFDDCFFPALDDLESRHNDGNDAFAWSDYDMNGDGFIDGLVVLFNSYFSENRVTIDGVPHEERITSHSRLADVANGWTSPSTGIQVGNYVTTSTFRGEEGERIARFNVIAHQILLSIGADILYDQNLDGYGCGGYCITSYPIGCVYLMYFSCDVFFGRSIY